MLLDHGMRPEAEFLALDAAVIERVEALSRTPWYALWRGGSHWYKFRGPWLRKINSLLKGAASSPDTDSPSAASHGQGSAR